MKEAAGKNVGIQKVQDVKYVSNPVLLVFGCSQLLVAKSGYNSFDI